MGNNMITSCCNAKIISTKNHRMNKLPYVNLGVEMFCCEKCHKILLNDSDLKEDEFDKFKNKQKE